MEWSSLIESYNAIKIYFVHISANVSYSADTTQESDNVELEVGKGVDALPFVGEQGESFLIGERSDGGSRYWRLWNCWEGFWGALKFKNIWCYEKGKGI